MINKMIDPSNEKHNFFYFQSGLNLTELELLNVSDLKKNINDFKILKFRKGKKEKKENDTSDYKVKKN